VFRDPLHLKGRRRRRLPASADRVILQSVWNDWRIERLQRILNARRFRSADAGPEHAEAAVALVIRPQDDLELLLIRRAERAGDPWSGHVAFPGGRRSPSDTDLSVTAFRETEEETGIALHRTGLLLGRLDDLPTSHRLPPVIISSFVAAVPPATPVTPNPLEVVHAEWIPLSALRGREAVSAIEVRRGIERMTFPTLVYQDYVIWGLTHHIVRGFLELVEEAGI